MFKFHLAAYSLLPFIVLAVSNAFLLAKIWLSKKKFGSRVSEREDQSKAKKIDKMNKIVILITILFILFTLPLAFAQFYFTQLFATRHGVFVIFLLDCLSFTYHGLNFFILFFSNHIFKKEVLRLLDSVNFWPKSDNKATEFSNINPTT